MRNILIILLYLQTVFNSVLLNYYLLYTLSSCRRSKKRCVIQIRSPPLHLHSRHGPILGGNKRVVIWQNATFENSPSKAYRTRLLQFHMSKMGHSVAQWRLENKFSSPGLPDVKLNSMSSRQGGETWLSSLYTAMRVPCFGILCLIWISTKS